MEENEIVTEEEIFLTDEKIAEIESIVPGEDLNEDLRGEGDELAD